LVRPQSVLQAIDHIAVHRIRSNSTEPGVLAEQDVTHPLHEEVVRWALLFDESIQLPFAQREYRVSFCRSFMGLPSLLGAAFYYHPLLTATVIGVIGTSIYIIRNTRRPT
jgi:hypothetical protein